MSTTTSEMAVEAKAYIVSTVTPDEPIEFERHVGYHGKTKTIRLAYVRVRWVLDMVGNSPAWRPSENVVGNNVKADGSLGAPVQVWEYMNAYNETRPNRIALAKFVKDAIESTRPAVVPTFTLNPEA